MQGCTYEDMINNAIHFMDGTNRLEETDLTPDESNAFANAYCEAIDLLFPEMCVEKGPADVVAHFHSIGLETFREKLGPLKEQEEVEAEPFTCKKMFDKAIKVMENFKYLSIPERKIGWQRARGLLIATIDRFPECAK